ncbi:MAG: helix-turn-helix domain-containing protein, partial [Acidobacteriaceae bacterium]
MSIGQQLRQAREEQGISLDQASQATHIRLHYLEAMEAEQFERLPSSVQLRGFLRAYGEYLRLNPADLIQLLEGNPQAAPASIPQPSVVNIASPKGSSSEVIFKELGQKLRLQRELMGLSLGDVERHTHIRMHYVRALEEGDIAHLPSPVQGRGMLSNYASFLGLNTEEILLHFADGLQAGLYDRQTAKRPAGSKAPGEEPRRLPARPSQLRRLFSMDLFVGGFLIIFLLGFIIWGAMRISALNSGQEPIPTAPLVSEILLSTQDDFFTTTPGLLPTTLAVDSEVIISATVPITATLVAIPTETISFQPAPGASDAPVQVYI